MGFLNKLFGIPEVHSKHGEMIDQMLEIVHWFMLLLFVGWSLYLTIAIWKHHRSRAPKASYSGYTGNATTHIEIGVILAEVILLLGLAFPLWSKQVDNFPDPDVRIHAWAYQFGWNFHYPGPDGRFGQTDRFKISSTNPVGLEKEDPNAADDFISSSLVIPKDKKIEISVTSKDVIHNLALVGMRIATDADPGKVNRIWFVPTKAGLSEVICGQLCGPAHGNMKAICEVVNDMKSFDGWATEQNRVFPDLGPAAAAVPVVFTPPPAAPVAAVAALAVSAPAAATVNKLTLGVIPNVMKFDQDTLTVKTGEKVQLLFRNEKCALMHNILIGTPGSKDAIGGLADKMMTDPSAMAKAYIPDSSDILFKGTKLVPTGQSDLLEFTAPAPGDYPYICTFPGHWRLMQGVLKVLP